MAAHDHLKNEFTEDKKYHDLMSWLKYGMKSYANNIRFLNTKYNISPTYLIFDLLQGSFQSSALAFPRSVTGLLTGDESSRGGSRWGLGLWTAGLLTGFSYLQKW